MFDAVKLSKDTDGSWLVDVPALPFVHTHGRTREAALVRAVEAVLTGLEMLVDDKVEIPRPLQAAPARGEAVRRSALVAAKIEQALAALGRRLVVTSAA